jgi:hypothetical protein
VVRMLLLLLHQMQIVNVRGWVPDTMG